MKKLLEVRGLKSYFYTIPGVVKAVRGVSFDIDQKSIVGLIGETGCGKSVIVHSILQLLLPPGKVVAGNILYYGSNGSCLDLAHLDSKSEEIRLIRGAEISIIFQDPMTCLSPVHTIGNQIIEAVSLRNPDLGKREARNRAIELLKEVGMPKPERHIDTYSFELSGGMRQRAMIAVALSGKPKLLLADEPTTSVDVTIQRKIIDLLKELHQNNSMSILYVTHDLGVIAQIVDKVATMYLGKIVEYGNIDDIYDHPKHPYTQLLLQCIPSLSSNPKRILTTIEGRAPDPYLVPPGCPFAERCPQLIDETCNKFMPESVRIEGEHRVSCFLYSSEKEESNNNVQNSEK